MNGHFVYKYVYNGEIVYIGKNDTDLITRIKQHKSEEKFIPYLSSDIYYMSLNNERDSDLMESLLIQKYKPLLNVSKKYSYEQKIAFIEPEWKKYFENDFRLNKTTQKKPSKRSLGKSRKALNSMLKKLSYCQEIHTCAVKEIDGNMYIQLAYDLDNIPAIITIDDDRNWDSFKLFKTCEECDDGKTAIYKLDVEGYKKFQDNFDLILKQYKEKIKDFTNSNDLDCCI